MFPSFTPRHELEDELTRLRSELAAAQKEIEMLHADVAEAESDAKDYASELTAGQERSAQLSIENAELLQREEELVLERTALRAEVERLTKGRDTFETRIKKEACSIANAVIEINADDLESWKARAQSAEAELGKMREAAKLVVATPWGQSLYAAIDALRALIEEEGE